MASRPQQAPVAAPAADSPTWRQRYVQGSFRGATFVTQQRERVGGRRIALFELPFRDTPVGEDLGRRAREATIDCFVHGADYMDARDALVNALEAFGPGTFVDPWTGEQLQVMCEDFRWSESTDEGGMARFTILFAKPASKSRCRLPATPPRLPDRPRRASRRSCPRASRRAFRSSNRRASSRMPRPTSSTRSR